MGGRRESRLNTHRTQGSEESGDCSLLLEYNEITGYHCRPLKDIISQTYDLQLRFLPDAECESSNPTKIKETKETINLFRKMTIKYRDAFKDIKK